MALWRYDTRYARATTALTPFLPRGYPCARPSVRPSPRRPRVATPGPPEGARWFPGTARVGRTWHGPKGLKSLPVGLSRPPACHGALPGVCATSAPENHDLSLPDRAEDAATSSTHMAEGPVRALFYGLEAFLVQHDLADDTSAARGAPTASQDIASGRVVGGAPVESGVVVGSDGRRPAPTGSQIRRPVSAARCQMGSACAVGGAYWQ